jgi:hypothetical protein
MNIYDEFEKLVSKYKEDNKIIKPKIIKEQSELTDWEKKGIKKMGKLTFAYLYAQTNERSKIQICERFNIKKNHMNWFMNKNKLIPLIDGRKTRRYKSNNSHRSRDLLNKLYEKAYYEIKHNGMSKTKACKIYNVFPASLNLYIKKINQPQKIKTNEKRTPTFYSR